MRKKRFCASTTDCGALWPTIESKELLIVKRVKREMLSAFRSLSLRATASNGACLSAPSSAFLQFSTTTVGSETSSEEDATAAFLDATAPAEERTVKTMKKDIRGSPRKLTYLAQQIRGLPAQEAILQLKFSPKRKAAIIQKTVQNAINLADIKYQIEPENLQVAECFVNKGHFLKRLRIMGRGTFSLVYLRGAVHCILTYTDGVMLIFIIFIIFIGRSGIMHHPHTHVTVVLREFDPSKKPLNRFLTKKLARETAAATAEKRDE